MDRAINIFNLISVISFWVYLWPKDDYALPLGLLVIFILLGVALMLGMFGVIITGSLCYGLDWILGKAVRYFKGKLNDSI